MNPLHYLLLIFALAGTISLTQADDIALLYALDADLAEFKETAQETGRPTVIGTRSIRRFQLVGHTIYTAKMGSGAVETAASAQALLTRFPCDYVLSIGPAGALSSNLSVGSWYRVNQVTAWQRGYEDATGYHLPESATQSLPWDKLVLLNSSNQYAGAKYIHVVSGEEFVATASKRSMVRSLVQADAVDMNTFGLSLVCTDHGVPLFVWRIISDHANEHASEDFRSFVTRYKGEGGRAIAEIIESIPPNPNTVDSYPSIRRFLEETE